MFVLKELWQIVKKDVLTKREASILVVDDILLAKPRGLNPKAVVLDSWYASLNNLKAIRFHGWIWITTLRKNRKINHNEILSEINIPDYGVNVHLRGYGWITVFKFIAQNGRINYISTSMENPTKDAAKALHYFR